jgi:HD-GYP domain-containing protein (c-di-GMP phosphodiesterase class II)
MKRRESQSVVRLLGRAFWMGAAALLAVAITAGLTYEANRREDRAVLHARERGRLGRESYIAAIDREDRVRGYLLTRDVGASAADDSARRILSAKLDTLAKESASLPAEDSLVARVRTGLARWDSAFVVPAFSSRAEPLAPALLSREISLFQQIRADFTTLRMAEDQGFVHAVTTGDHLRLYSTGSILLELAMIVAGFNRLRRGLIRQAKRVVEGQNEVLERLAGAAEFRDDDTGRHTRRVGDVSARIAKALGFDDGRVELVRRAAPLHDVGKIGIPDGILLKPGKLTDRELAVMRTHTTIGARILTGGQSDIVTMAEHIARSHHERWNGTGYPDGIQGERIPIEARIVAIADVFDALRSDRPYRKAWSLELVLDEIRRLRGSHFDPTIADVFLDRRCYEESSA